MLEFSKGYPEYLQLISTEPETYHYIGGANQQELNDLRDIDDDNVTIYGFHLIDNYEDLEDGTKDRD